MTSLFTLFFLYFLFCSPAAHFNQVLQGLRATPEDFEILQGRAKVEEGQSIVAAWQESGLIYQVFPLHETSALTQLQTNWVRKMFAPQPLGTGINFIIHIIIIIVLCCVCLCVPIIYMVCIFCCFTLPLFLHIIHIKFAMLDTTYTVSEIIPANDPTKFLRPLAAQF